MDQHWIVSFQNYLIEAFLNEPVKGWEQALSAR